MKNETKTKSSTYMKLNHTKNLYNNHTFINCLDKNKQLWRVVWIFSKFTISTANTLLCSAYPCLHGRRQWKCWKGTYWPLGSKLDNELRIDGRFSPAPMCATSSRGLIFFQPEFWLIFTPDSRSSTASKCITQNKIL